MNELLSDPNILVNRDGTMYDIRYGKIRFNKDGTIRKRVKSYANGKKRRKLTEEERKTYMRDYNANRKEEAREYKLIQKYGITKEEHLELYNKQEGKCAICKRPGDRIGKLGLQVDHCHKTNKVRELLCVNCNTVLGRIEDDPNLLLKFKEYLDRHILQSIKH